MKNAGCNVDVLETCALASPTVIESKFEVMPLLIFSVTQNHAKLQIVSHLQLYQKLHQILIVF